MAGKIEFKDKDGVKYIISINGFVFMELPIDRKNKRKPRKIGVFKNGVFIKYEKSNPDAVFIKFNAFGFPYHLVRYLYDHLGLKKIVVKITSYKRYEIDAEKFFEKQIPEQKFLNYKKKGYEFRVYVPIKYFQKIEGVSYEG